MVNRKDKRGRFTRWCIFCAKNLQAQAFKHTLRYIVVGGRAKIIFRDVSLYRVDLVWRTAVTYDSAARVISLAKKKQTRFEIMGVPTGIADDVGAVAAAAPTGVADDARGAQMKLRMLL